MTNCRIFFHIWKFTWSADGEGPTMRLEKIRTILEAWKYARWVKPKRQQLRLKEVDWFHIRQRMKVNRLDADYRSEFVARCGQVPHGPVLWEAEHCRRTSFFVLQSQVMSYVTRRWWARLSKSVRYPYNSHLQSWSFH